MLGTREDLSVDVLAYIRKGYELWNAGQLETVSQMWSEDVIWENDPSWPGQRTYHGRDSVVRFLREEVAGVIHLGDIHVEDVEVFGDQLMIKLHARTRGQDSNLDIGRVPVFHVARVQGGEVVRIRAFLDEAHALAAARGELGG